MREGKIKDCRFLFKHIMRFVDTAFKPTTLGGIGVSALTLLSNYQIPLRIVSILLLILAYYSISNKLTKSCTINYNNK